MDFVTRVMQHCLFCRIEVRYQSKNFYIERSLFGFHFDEANGILYYDVNLSPMSYRQDDRWPDVEARKDDPEIEKILKKSWELYRTTKSSSPYLYALGFFNARPSLFSDIYTLQEDGTKPGGIDWTSLNCAYSFGYDTESEMPEDYARGNAVGSYFLDYGTLDGFEFTNNIRGNCDDIQN